MSTICGSGVDGIVWVEGRANNWRKQRNGCISAPHNQKGENFMKKKLLLSMVAVSTLLMVPAIGFTQDKDAEVRTMTGCLSKAEVARAYTAPPETSAPL